MSCGMYVCIYIYVGLCHHTFFLLSLSLYVSLSLYIYASYAYIYTHNKLYLYAWLAIFLKVWLASHNLNVEVASHNSKVEVASPATSACERWHPMLLRSGGGRHLPYMFCNVIRIYIYIYIYICIYTCVFVFSHVFNVCVVFLSLSFSLSLSLSSSFSLYKRVRCFFVWAWLTKWSACHTHMVGDTQLHLYVIRDLYISFVVSFFLSFPQQVDVHHTQMMSGAWLTRLICVSRDTHALL